MSGTLPAWLERLLGFSSRTGEGTQWTLDVAWPWPPWATVVMIVAAVALIIFFYTREPAAEGTGKKRFLVGMRLLIFGVLLFMLAETTVNFQRTGLPFVLVMVDESASMGHRDEYESEELQETLAARLTKAGLPKEISRINLAKAVLLEEDARLLRKIQQKYKLRIYAVSADASEQEGDLPTLTDSVRAIDADGEASRLGLALRSALSEMRGTPPAAVVMLTDGITTSGEGLADVSSYARRKGVPLFFVGLGSQQPIRDVALTDLLVDDVVFVDDVVNFEVKLKATGLDAETVDVTLRDAASPAVLARKSVMVTDPNQTETLVLSHRPSKEGEHTFIVEVEPVEKQANAQNNRLDQVVSVRKEQIRVLLVQAYPNHEYDYLKAMMERDKTIDVNVVLQEADVEYAQIDRSALRVFPVRREELFKYDVIIFGDVNPAGLGTTSQVMEHLRDFVEQKGGGIVFIAGPRYTPYAYLQTPLGVLLPFGLGEVSPPSGAATEAFILEPTEFGLSSPQMQLGNSAVESATIWRNLPPLYWMAEASSHKQAARVIAQHPTRLDANGQPMPLILMQYVGAGKVITHMTDETWRWRLRQGDTYFARYWVQTIRYLARSKLLGGDRSAELLVDRGRYTRGEPVQIRVRFLDERRAPAADDGATVVIEKEGSRSRTMKLERASTSRGIFTGVFTDASEGRYHVWLSRPTLEGRAPAAEFVVEAPAGEFEQIEMNEPELSRAAELSRGKYYTITTAGELVDDLPRGRHVPIETLPPLLLWKHPITLALFLSLLIGEWLLRKRKGLL